MADELNEYDALLQQDQAQAATALRSSALQAQQYEPEQYAKSKQLAAVTGVPAPIVAKNLPEISKRADLNEYDNLLSSSPELAKKMSDPEFAAVARKDLTPLQALEGLVANTKDAILPVAEIPWTGAKSLARIPLGLLESLSQLAGAFPAGAGVQEQFGTAPADWWFKNVTDVIRAKKESLALSDQAPLEQKAVDTIANVAGELALAMTGGALLKSAEVPAAVTAAPSVLAKIGTALKTGFAAALPAGVEQSIPLAAEAVRKGAPSEDALKAAVVDHALRTLMYALPVSMEGAPIKRALTALGMGIPAQEAQRRTLNEFLPQTMQRPFTWEGEATQDLLNVGLALLMGPRGSALVKAESSAKAAEVHSQAVSDILKTAQASNLLAIDAPSFKSFLQALTPDGHPIADVWLNPSTLKEAGVDINALAKLSPSFAGQMAEGLALKGEVLVPTAELATVLPGSGLEQAIIPHIRATPDAMTQAEARSYAQVKIDTTQAEMAKALAAGGESAKHAESVASVEREIMAQLNTANRFTPDVNSTKAKYLSAIFATEAQRTGKTAEQVWLDADLRITSEGIEGAQHEQRASLTAPEAYRTISKIIKEVQAGKVDPATLAHESSAASVASMLAKELGLTKERTADITLAALAHDVGKSRIPLDVLLAQRKLTPDEYAQIKLHPEAGAKMLKDAGIPDTIAEIVLHHHRNYTTEGYPAAKEGEYLTFASQILHVADVVSAVGKSDPGHPYVEGAGVQKAIEILKASPEKFNPEIVAAFEKMAAQGRLPRAFQDSIIAPREGAEYNQSVNRVTAGGLTFPVIENPTREAAANLAERATDGRLRGFRDDAGNLHVWDASKAIHAQVATELGINDTGSITRFEWSADEIRNAPQKIFSGESNSYYQAGKRGSIRFPEGGVSRGRTTLTLTANANLSTFFHEVGHFATEMMFSMARSPDASPQIKEDAQKLLTWVGVPDLAAWDALPTDKLIIAHEQLARGHEAYVMEGKAPSPELTSVFARVMAWMKSIYSTIQGLNASHKAQTGADLMPLSDEVRGVWDRMLATDAEIEAKQAENHVASLFDTPEEGGMTTAEWQAYRSQMQDQTDQAISILQTRAIGDMRWLTGAQGRVLKAMQRDASAKRAAIEAEVTAEVRQEPIYAALRFLHTGKVRDDEGGLATVEKFKLDTETVLADYPELKGVLNDHLRGITGPDGVSPDFVAEQFGLSSGDELIRKLVHGEVKPEADVIRERTDQRTLERYGDLTTPEALQRAAGAAIANEAHTRFISTEMNALTRALGDKRVLASAAKEAASGMIAQKQIRYVRPGQFSVADRKSGREADKAFKAGDIAAAAAAKRNQLVNAYATRAANDALGEVDKGLRYLRDLSTKTSISGDYRQQIAQLLDRFNLKPMTEKEMARAKGLAEWAAEQEAQGLQPVVDPRLLAEAQRKPFKEMTVEEFRGLIDTVRNIEHLGKLKQKLLTARDERTYAEHVEAAASSIHANARVTLPEKIEHNTWADRAGKGVKEFFAMHRKFASYLRQLDGFKDGGAMWELFGREANRAGDTEAVMREQATTKLSELLKTLPAGRMTKKMFIPDIARSLSREGRLMIALNTGNEGNLQRLRDGDHWTDAQIKAITDTLTKPEWDFVQHTWDLISEYRDQIGAQQQRLTGLEPKWVAPTPVATPHGTYAGGYFPAKYDTDRSTRSLSLEAAQDVMNQWRATLGSPTTRKSFTKERAAAVTERPLRKDFGVLTQHLSEVTHRLAWQDYLTDANRLLRAEPVDAAIREHYGSEVLASMRNAVEDIAAGDVGAQNSFEASVSYLRQGATIVGLGWRLTTALLQPLGLTQSMVRIGPKWVAKGLVEWLGDATKMENTAKRIYGKSDMMRLRGKTLQREISEIRNQISGKNSTLEASYFYLIQKLQLVADIPTWLGEYRKAVEHDSADEATAVARADQAVLDAQGGGQTKDLAEIQRGGPLMKLFTNFYSFFNTTYNLTAESVGRAKITDPVSMGRLAVDMLLLYVVPSTLGTLMKAALKGEDDEDRLTRRLVSDQLSYLFGTMVGLREIAGGLNALTGLPGGDYQGPAGLRFMSELGKLAKQVDQGELDNAAINASANVGGILFHFPTGQLENTLLGVKALINGDTNNLGALIVGPGPKK